MNRAKPVENLRVRKKRSRQFKRRSRRPALWTPASSRASLDRSNQERKIAVPDRYPKPTRRNRRHREHPSLRTNHRRARVRDRGHCVRRPLACPAAPAPRRPHRNDALLCRNAPGSIPDAHPVADTRLRAACRQSRSPTRCCDADSTGLLTAATQRCQSSGGLRSTGSHSVSFPYIGRSVLESARTSSC
jgi:hypothetical protein